MPSAGIRGRNLSRQPGRHEILKSKLCHTLFIGMTSSYIVRQLICFVVADERVPEPTGSYPLRSDSSINSDSSMKPGVLLLSRTHSIL